MKNKTKTYLLLITVLSIWGTIGYKIITATRADSPNIPIDTIEASFTPNTIKKKDIFSIQPVDRDPFLGTLTNRNNTRKKKTVKSTFEENAKQPEITYHGMVKKQNSSSQIFTLSINNQQYLIKKGQIVADITLVRGNAKEILVRYNGIKRTILIQ